MENLKYAWLGFSKKDKNNETQFIDNEYVGDFGPCVAMTKSNKILVTDAKVIHV